MNTFLVSYDLIRPVKDYANLHAHLRSYFSWAKPLESVWLIKSNLGFAEVRDTIHAHMDSNDKLLVVDVTGRGAGWYHLSEDVSTWLKTNLL